MFAAIFVQALIGTALKEILNKSISESSVQIVIVILSACAVCFLMLEILRRVYKHQREKPELSNIHSEAAHDAQFASYMLPTTMIFVQSKDGLSHCEPEFSSVEHCTEGATVMLNAVLKADAD